MFAHGARCQPCPHLCQHHAAVPSRLHNTPRVEEWAAPTGASSQPQGGDRAPAPELPAWLHSSIYTANSWHMSPGEGGGRGPLFGLDLGKGEKQRIGGWERHRDQSARSKQSWGRETTTSCQALLKTRRAQKGKGGKTKGLGGEAGGAGGGHGARALGLKNYKRAGNSVPPRGQPAPAARWGFVVCLRREQGHDNSGCAGLTLLSGGELSGQQQSLAYSCAG